MLRAFQFFLLLMFSFKGNAGNQNGFQTLTILNTNYVHGHAWPEKEKGGRLLGGLAAQALMVDQIRKELVLKKSELLIVSAGDVNTGVPESDHLNGEPDFKVMNLIGYDAMVLGNHEFDHGLEKIIKQSEWAKFPFLSSNVYFQSKPLKFVRPHLIIKKGKLTLGLIGFVTTDLPNIILSKHSEGLTVTDPLLETRKALEQLNGLGVDLPIILSHLGIETDRKLAQEFSKTPLVIVGGHSHTLLPTGEKNNEVLITQAGSHGEHLGRIDIEWNFESKKIEKTEASVIPVLPEKGEQPKAKLLLEKFRKRVAKILEKKIGEVDFDLDGERESIRHRETNLGNLITDIIKTESKSDVAIYNGGGIRSSIPKGDIKLRDIYRVLPFRNTVVTALVTGDQLKQAIESGIRNQNDSGSFLQISGFEYHTDGKSVTQMIFLGKPMEMKSKFKVASCNFIFSGGDKIEGLKGVSNLNDSLIPIDKVVTNYLKRHKKIKPPIAGRIHLSQSTNPP